MNQQVNLYQPNFRQRQPAFSAGTLVAMWAALVCVIVPTHRLTARHLRAVQAELHHTEQHENQVLARLESVTGAFVRVKDDSARELLDEAVRRLSERERLLGMLRSETMGSTKGFSAHLSALARRAIDGMWLTRIVVSAPGRQTTLEGRAREPELVPIYLQGLAHEQALSGQRFAQFTIERPEKDDLDGVRFSMTSQFEQHVAQSRGVRQR